MTKKEEAERLKLAKELCEKEGKDWDALDDYGKHSYGHYADVVIRKRLQAPKEAVKEAPAAPPANQCPVCEGKRFIEEQHGLTQVECEACGGTGIVLAEEKVKPPEEKPAPVHKHYFRKGTGLCKCGAARKEAKAK